MKRFVLGISCLLVLAFYGVAAEVLNTLYFGFEMAEMTPEAADVLKAAADKIKSSGAKAVVVTAYCDTAEEKPQDLSAARAKAVADELRKFGVPEGIAITSSGKGAADLARSTGPNVREPLNRRVTVAY